MGHGRLVDMITLSLPINRRVTFSIGRLIYNTIVSDYGWSGVILRAQHLLKGSAHDKNDFSSLYRST